MKDTMRRLLAILMSLMLLLGSLPFAAIAEPTEVENSGAVVTSEPTAEEEGNEIATIESSNSLTLGGIVTYASVPALSDWESLVEYTYTATYDGVNKRIEGKDIEYLLEEGESYSFQGITVYSYSNDGTNGKIATTSGKGTNKTNAYNNAGIYVYEIPVIGGERSSVYVMMEIKKRPIYIATPDIWTYYYEGNTDANANNCVLNSVGKLDSGFGPKGEYYVYWPEFKIEEDGGIVRDVSAAEANTTVRDKGNGQLFDRSSGKIAPRVHLLAVRDDVESELGALDNDLGKSLHGIGLVVDNEFQNILTEGINNSDKHITFSIEKNYNNNPSTSITGVGTETNAINLSSIIFKVYRAEDGGTPVDVTDNFEIGKSEGTLEIKPIGRVRYNSTAAKSLEKVIDPQYGPLVKKHKLTTETDDDENDRIKSVDNLFKVGDLFVIADGEPSDWPEELKNITFLGWFDKYRHTTRRDLGLTEETGYYPAIREAGETLEYVYAGDDLYTLDALWASISVENEVKVYDAEPLGLKTFDISYNTGLNTFLKAQYLDQINGKFTDSYRGNKNAEFTTDPLVTPVDDSVEFNPEVQSEDPADANAGEWSSTNPGYITVGKYNISVKESFDVHTSSEQVDVAVANTFEESILKVVQTVEPATVTILKRPLLVQFGSKLDIPFDNEYHKGELPDTDEDHGTIDGSDDRYTSVDDGGEFFKYSDPEVFGDGETAYSYLYDAEVMGLVPGHYIELAEENIIYTNEETDSADYRGGKAIGSYSVDVKDKDTSLIKVFDENGIEVTQNYEIATIPGKVTIVKPENMAELLIVKKLEDAAFVEQTVNFQVKRGNDVLWFVMGENEDGACAIESAENEDGAVQTVSITLKNGTNTEDGVTTERIALYVNGTGVYEIHELNADGTPVANGATYTTEDNLKYLATYDDNTGPNDNCYLDVRNLERNPEDANGEYRITVTNTAQFYRLKHYVADLDDNGDRETTDIYAEVENYTGYVPFEEGYEVIDGTSKTGKDVNQAQKDSTYPDDKSIEDQHIYSGNAPDDSRQDDYNLFTYAAMFEADTKIDPGTNLGAAYMSGNVANALEDPNTYYQNNEGADVLKPGAVVPVFWDRVLEFTTDEDARNVAAVKIDIQENPQPTTNFGAVNSIRQSQINFITHYILWNAMGFDGDEDLGEEVPFEVKDSWQDSNVIKVKYTNTKAGGYIFHSATDTTVADANGHEPSGVQVYDEWAYLDNTEGGSTTDLYLVPMILVQYHTRSFDAYDEIDSESSYIVKKFFTVDIEGGALKNPHIGTEYLTKITLDAKKSGYTDWKLKDWNGDLAKNQDLDMWSLYENGYIDFENLATDAISGGKYPVVNLYAERRVPLATPEPSSPGTRTITGRKVWRDNDNAAGLRPDSITVWVLQNGSKYQSQTVTAANGWMYQFTNLPLKDPSGNMYSYTIGEDMVEFYSGHVEGLNLVNELMDNIPDGPGEGGFSGSELTEEQLESAVQLYDYGSELWSDPLQTGDELPVYPFVFGGVGIAAVAVLLVLNLKKRKNGQ